jgi:hypothetical protein
MTEQHYQAFKWATENNIRIYPKIKGKGFVLILERNGKTETSGKEYSKKDYQDVIWEFYLTLYNKSRNE